MRRLRLRWVADPARIARVVVVAMALAATLTLVPTPARAQWRVADVSGHPLELGGYVRSLTAVHDLGYDLPLTERQSAFHGDVLRLKWTWAGDDWSFTAHQRLQTRVSTSAVGGAVVGFGVGAPPGRSLDLETTLVDGDRFRVWHDLDRLSVTFRAGPADVTLGRQAITWGLAALFPVVDLWARFSPFEQDTEEKPGVDAARALVYPAEGVELDLMVADRGSWDELSAGGKVNLTLGSGDVYLAAGKFWREMMVAAGGLLLLDEARLRAEVAVPYGLSGAAEEGWDRPRATVGADWIRGRLAVTGELHHNGIGATDAADYGAVAADPRFARGETYFLGRTYVGALASWMLTDRATVGVSALVNVGDPSASVTPTFTYDFGQDARVTVGGLVSGGEEPFLVGVVPRLGSEFGSYGGIGFGVVSVYF